MRNPLNLLLSAIAVTTWRQAAAAVLARAVVFFLLMLMSTILALTGLGFGLYAAFISLCLFMSPAAAAATIGATMVTIAAVVTIVAFRRPRVEAGRPKPGAHAWMPAIEDIDSLTNALRQWVQADPGGRRR